MKERQTKTCVQSECQTTKKKKKRIRARKAKSRGENGKRERYVQKLKVSLGILH